MSKIPLSELPVSELTGITEKPKQFTRERVPKNVKSTASRAHAWPAREAAPGARAPPPSRAAGRRSAAPRPPRPPQPPPPAAPPRPLTSGAVEIVPVFFTPFHGPFSAESTPMFATKGSYCGLFQALQDDLYIIP